MTIIRIDPGSRMSQAAASENLVFLAGQVAEFAESRSVRDQAEQILRRCDVLLSQVGSDRSRILQTTIWLRNMTDYAEFNAVWDAWIDPRNPPPRACTQAILARPEWLVEVMLIAAR